MRIHPLLLATVALPGCATLGPDYQPPSPLALSVPEAYHGRPAGASSTDLARWWEQFDDPLLTRLIEEAGAANLDLVVAASRLLQARESLVQARAGLVPVAGASAGAGRSVGPGDDRTSLNIGADAAWG